MRCIALGSQPGAFFVCPAIGRSEKSVIARADCAKTIQEEMKMRESKFKNYDALPLTLTALTSESAHGFLFQKTSLSSGLTSKRRWMDEIV